jgi:hypothetical protein
MTEKEKKALENFKKASANFSKKTESPQPDGVIITKKDGDVT